MAFAFWPLATPLALLSTTFFLVHWVLDTLILLWTFGQVKQAPSLGLEHFLFSLLRKISPLISLAPSFHSGLCSSAIFLDHS